MYKLSAELASFLMSDEACQALRTYAGDDLSVSTQILEKLRKAFSPTQAAALYEQVILRKKAREKFPYPWPLLFTDEALQQASSYAIASYHADTFSRYERIADLGCGIGGDTLAFAGKIPSVMAIEIDPVLCQLLQHNIAVAGFDQRVQIKCADWTDLDLGAIQAAFLDPSRRVKGQRVFKLSEMTPPIEKILVLQRKVKDIAVKVAPGISHDELPDGSEVEFISEKGTLKEALLRFGDLRTGQPRAATILPGLYQMRPLDVAPQVETSLPRAYLFEPDPAILRAFLVKDLAMTMNSYQLDESIAYMTSDNLTPTPFARAWKVRQHGPFNLKHLNEWLREIKAGEVVIKKRGSPIVPDEFQKRLKTFEGGLAVTLFITKVRHKPWMILCEAEIQSVFL